MNRQGNDPALRRKKSQFPDGRETIHAGHFQVHEDNIRLEARDQVERVVPMGSLAEDVNICFESEPHPQPGADSRLVIHNDKSDHQRNNFQGGRLTATARFKYMQAVSVIRLFLTSPIRLKFVSDFRQMRLGRAQGLDFSTPPAAIRYNHAKSHE